MRCLGISRDVLFSPNRSEADAGIFLSVASELKDRGKEVIRLTEQELVETGVPDDIDCVFQMARSKEALDILEKVSIPVINSVRAVRNCNRAVQTRILQYSGFVPYSIIGSTNDLHFEWMRFPCWIKKGKGHAVDRDDVQFIRDYEELRCVIKGFAERKIENFVLQEHVIGRLFKFYGVRGYGLVGCYDVSMKDSKFGLEQYNDMSDESQINRDLLTVLAEHVSQLLDVDIYGGDVILRPDGDMMLIDFNDWPSFQSCRELATQKIAELICARK